MMLRHGNDYVPYRETAVQASSDERSEHCRYLSTLGLFQL